MRAIKSQEIAHPFEAQLSLLFAWRADSTHYRLAGSVALLSAFSVGALWLRLHEANDSIVHVIEWHYLPILAIGIAGL
jgi:hypothetical protein